MRFQNYFLASAFRSFLFQVATLLILLISLTSFSYVNAKNDLSTALTDKEIHEAVDKLANHLPSLQHANTQAMFDRVGFKPDMPLEDWKALPFQEQLEIAYRSAQAHHDGNGQNFLKAMAKLTESNYESLRYDPAFRSFFSSVGNDDLNKRIEFTKPTNAELKEELPKNVKRQLSTLSYYVDGNGPMSRVNVARNIFGLKSPELERALAKRDSKDFLHRAAELTVPPPNIENRIKVLADKTMHFYESAARDPVIKDISRKFGEFPLEFVRHDSLLMLNERGNFESFDPVNNPGGRGGGPERIIKAAKQHAHFDNTHYKTSESKSFRTVRARAGGRGGVIAGAEITSGNSILGKPVKVSIEVLEGSCDSPHPEQILGSIKIELSNGKVLSYPNVPCDELITAKRIVFDKIESIHTWEPDEAIGLVSIDLGNEDDEPVFPYFIPENLDPSKIGNRKRMILHPAIVDWDIGRSITLLDLWPSVTGAINQRTNGSSVVLDWLKEMDTMEVITWKFSDSAATLHAENEVLKVSPTGKQSHLLTMRAFNKMDVTKENILESGLNELCDDIDDEQERLEAILSTGIKGPTKAYEEFIELDYLEDYFQCDEIDALDLQSESGQDLKNFDKALSALRRGIPDFDRTENFLKTLAIYRWARKNNAEFEGKDPLIPSERRKSPDTLIVALDKSWIAIAPDGKSFKDDCNTFINRLDNLKLKISDPEFELALRPIDAANIEMLIQHPSINQLRETSCELPSQSSSTE